MPPTQYVIKVRGYNLDNLDDFTTGGTAFTVDHGQTPAASGVIYRRITMASLVTDFNALAYLIGHVGRDTGHASDRFGGKVTIEAFAFRGKRLKNTI